MKTEIRVALDVMGGDHGPGVVVPAAAIALERRPDLRFLLYGDEKIIAPLLSQRRALAAKSRLIHCDVAIKMTDKPSQALRSGRRMSSMWRAIEAVKKGEADCAVSAGNTGALMAMAKICLRMLPLIERPAIAAMWPTLRGESIVLDVGATIGADSRHLIDLAIMGAAMARIVFDIECPTVGLLNVGVEEIKGLDEVKSAGRVLKETKLPNLDYRGFVEGDDLGKGTVDVIVTEGFTGNIALKTAEGTAKQIGQYMRDAMRETWLSRLGYWLARDAFRALRDKMDPGRVNGGVFLGLDGVASRVMAAPTTPASPARSRSVTTWSVRNCSKRFAKWSGSATQRAPPPPPPSRPPEPLVLLDCPLDVRIKNSFRRARRRLLSAKARALERRTGGNGGHLR
jgi:glycerol-3-phosphate acyltransferase PlsX